MTTQTQSDETDSALPPMDPLRELATDAAKDAVPHRIDGLTFEDWTDAVDVVRGDILATLEREVPA